MVQILLHSPNKEIRDFSFRSLKYLAEIKAQAEYICLTLHGANYGLDETEAFLSEIAGVVEATTKGLYPFNLNRISMAEFNEPRAKRLRAVLQQLLPGGFFRTEGMRGITQRSPETDQFRLAGLNSEEKPLIFVAMPFGTKMDDIFHYGIRNAVNNAGFLCERADEVIFTGDTLRIPRN